MDRGQQQVWMHLATSAVPDVVLAVTSETLKKFAKKFGRAGKWHLGILSRHSSGSWRSQAHGPELRHLIRLMHVAVIGRLPGAKPPKQNREYISRQRVAKNIWLVSTTSTQTLTDSWPTSPIYPEIFVCYLPFAFLSI